MRLTLRLLRHSVPRNDKGRACLVMTVFSVIASRRHGNLGGVNQLQRVVSPKSTARGYCINILKVASIICNEAK